MKKIVPEHIIEGCCQCDSLVKHDYVEFYFTCARFSRRKRIEDIDEIPSWCKLKDYKESTAKNPNSSMSRDRE